MNTNKTILLISDGYEQFASTVSLLQHEGFDVRFESDVSKSLTPAGCSPPRLIISELAVPNVDGLQLCRRVRQDTDLEATPVLLIGDLSKHSSIVEDGFRCGAADYLQKPIDPFKLADICRDIMESDDDRLSSEREQVLFDSLTGNISGAIAVIDPCNGTILFESPSAGQTLGFGEGELFGQSLFGLVHPGDMAEVREYLGSMHWGVGLAEPVEFRLRQTDGSWKLIEATGTTTEDTRLGGAVVLTMHESHATEFSFCNVIREEILRKTMFDQACSGIALFSMSGHFIQGNAALLKMLDYPENVLFDMSLSDFVFSSDGDDDRRGIVDVMSGRRGAHKFENGYITPTGERIWGQLTVIRVSGETPDGRFLIGIFENPSRRNDAAPDAASGAMELSNLPKFDKWKIDNGLVCKN